MKINDIGQEDVKKKKIYYYTNDENTEIEEFKSIKKFIPKNSGYYLITGKIKIADGTTYPAVIGVSSDDSGEIFEAYFLVGSKLINQNKQDFLKLISKGKNQVFPYKYHLNIKVDGDMHKSHQF